MTEEWKDIKGYEGLYQVSNYGRVKSLTRWSVSARSYVPAEVIMSPTDNGNGYLIVSLSRGTHRKNHYVHRLVAEAFVENPNGRNYVNHLDYDKRNNRSDNLEWCTQKENVLYSAERMRKPRKRHKLSSTGFKYIYYCTGKEGYRVKGPKREHWAKTLSEAIRIREEVRGEVV